jgi:hypothetical protein
MQLQTVKAQKTTGSITVTFPTAFSNVPTVIVSSFWSGSSSPVGVSETVTAVSTTQCVITSGNAASNYYVSVLAVDTGQASFGALPIVAGNAQKNQGIIEINFPNGALSSPDPVILLTPLWQNSGTGVGAVDTLDNSGASECTVASGNQASAGYFTAYVAADVGSGAVNGRSLISGIANKPASGLLRVYFPQAFKSAPDVVISPWWNDQNAGVGSIDTVTNVTPSYFELTSANAAHNYFVNWMAVG